jgi:hypothetical protein
MTQTLTRSSLDNYSSKEENQNKLTNRRIKINISNQYSKIVNSEETNPAYYLSSIINREPNNQQIYTNQFWTRLKFLPESSLSLKEVSNTLVNQEFVSLLNNFINKIRDNYIIQNQNEILDYLSQKRELIATLLKAKKEIRKIFLNEKLTLKVICDPEIANWKQLVIFIHTKLNADEAFNKLKLLDHNWWLDASYDIGNDLEIHIDFDEI